MAGTNPESDDKILCFVSHKCEGAPCMWKSSSPVGDCLRTIFAAKNVRLLIDPFAAGENLTTRIETVSFDTLLFLHCRESWESPWCQKELAVARERHVPVFVIRLRDEIPSTLRDERLVVNIESLSVAEMQHKLCPLAEKVRHRGRVRRQILNVFDGSNTAADQRRLAEEIEDEEDVAAIAEFIEMIDRHYTLAVDPAARAALARTVGRSNSAGVLSTLKRWRRMEDHPYPKDAISDALEALSDSVPPHPKRHANMGMTMLVTLCLSGGLAFWGRGNMTRSPDVVPGTDEERLEVIERLEQQMRDMLQEIEHLKQVS